MAEAKETKSAPSTQTESTTPVQKKGPNTTVIIIIVVVVLLLCAGCGVGGYLLYKAAADAAEEELNTLSDDLSDSYDWSYGEDVDLGEGTWESVLTMEGSASDEAIQTDNFTVVEPGWKVVYTVDSTGDLTMFSAYITDPTDGTVIDYPAFLEDADGEATFTTTGEYYLDIYPTDCDLTVEVLQFVPAE